MTDTGLLIISAPPSEFDGFADHVLYGGRHEEASSAPAGHLPEAPPIGRELALATLAEILKAVLGGAGRTCLITGEAGVGKTRLIQELLLRAEPHDCHVLRGKSQDYDHGVAYVGLRDILNSAATDDFDPSSRTEFNLLLETLDGAASGQRGGAHPPTDTQPAYLQVTRFLSSLCESRPAVVALDDAHLADDETLTALSLAARHLASLPLFLVFSARRDQWLPGSTFAATVGRLVESGLGTLVHLDPLDLDDTTALVASVLGGRPDERLTSYVYSRSRGNPLFVREALRSLQQVGALRLEHNKCYLVGDPPMGELSNPAALLHRVFQQDSAGRELARVMSAFRRVHVDQVAALQEVTGMEASRLERAFDDLTRASILTRVSTGWYEFTHPLMAEVLYRDLGPLERRRLHKLIAASFRRERFDDLTDVLECTTHIAEAATPGDPTAISAVLEAALLTRNTAPLSAAIWYQRALDLLSPSAADRPGILSRQAIALWKGSRPEAAVEVGKRALQELAGGEQSARTLATVINACYAMGRYGDALELANAQIGEVDDPTPFLLQKALLLAHMGRIEEAVEQRGSAEAHAGMAKAADQPVTLSYLGHVASCLGEFPRVRDAVDRLLNLGTGREPLLSPGARLSALETAGYLLAVTGCLSDGRAVLDEVVALLPHTGWQDIGGQNVYAKTKLHQMAGEWDEALDTIHAGAISLEFSGLRNNLAWLKLTEAELLIDKAQLDDATRILQEPLLPPECLFYEALRDCREARLAMALGENGRAERILCRIQSSHSTLPVEAYRQCLEQLVDLYVSTNRRDLAVQAARELRELASRTSTPIAILSADLADAALGNALIAEQLTSRCEAEGLLFAAAQAHYHLAGCAINIETNLARAAELFDGMGAVLWKRRAVSRAKELGVSVAIRRAIPVRKMAGNPPKLTRIEVQLIKLLRQGLTNRQISSVMHYSPKTVEVYLSRLYQKLGSHSRLEVVLASERGEIPGLPLVDDARDG
jgi:DNA-binding NarL/FixJ family response regulator